MVNFPCPANRERRYYARSTYADMFCCFYFGIRIFLFHGERSLHQSLLSDFSALIFNLYLALSIQRYQYLFVRSRNPNFSVSNGLDLCFVSTKPYCKRGPCAFLKCEGFEICTASEQDMTNRRVSNQGTPIKRSSWIF